MGVDGLAIEYILAFSLIVVNVVPETFLRFFDDISWREISLTLVGYGDSYVVSPVGKVIVALLAGIVITGDRDKIIGNMA